VIGKAEIEEKEETAPRQRNPTSLSFPSATATATRVCSRMKEIGDATLPAFQRFLKSQDSATLLKGLRSRFCCAQRRRPGDLAERGVRRERKDRI